MPQNPIQAYASSIIKGLVAKSEGISGLDHNLTKGQLREILVSDVFKFFLTSQFGVGSGIIVNQKGIQSNQTDIIIYDNEFLPPFIKEQNIGVYPIESVVATIEVKSRLVKNELLKSENAARRLHTKVCDPDGSYYQDIIFPKPLCAVIGFYGNGAKEIDRDSVGNPWLDENTPHIQAICLVNKFSWIKLEKDSWRFEGHNRETNGETKRFIAVILDNIRTLVNERTSRLGEVDIEHRDWLGIYLRDQGLFVDGG